MPAIGGVKGTLAYPWTNLQSASQILSPLVPDDLVSIANNSFPGLVDLPLGSPEALASFSLNLKDNITEGNTSGVPLQFVFEPADCRIFYNPKTVFSPLLLWGQVHDIAWNGGKCAYGGIRATTNGTSGSGDNTTTPGQVPTTEAAKAENGMKGIVMVIAAVAGALAI